MQDRAWISEGIAFCAQSKSTGTNANLPMTTTGFEALGGFSGAARWKTEIAGVERKVTANLALSFAANGAINGRAAAAPSPARSRRATASFSSSTARSPPRVARTPPSTVPTGASSSSASATARSPFA